MLKGLDRTERLIRCVKLAIGCGLSVFFFVHFNLNGGSLRADSSS